MLDIYIYRADVKRQIFNILNRLNIFLNYKTINRRISDIEKNIKISISTNIYIKINLY